jgi:hypothetical protein
MASTLVSGTKLSEDMVCKYGVIGRRSFSKEGEFMVKNCDVPRSYTAHDTLTRIDYFNCI